MSYCKCGGYLGSGGIDMYAGRWCRCASPNQSMSHSFSTGKLVVGRYVSEEELQSIESQLKEAKELVRGLTACLVRLSNFSEGTHGSRKISSWECLEVMQIELQERMDYARQCLKDNAESIERLTKPKDRG